MTSLLIAMALSVRILSPGADSYVSGSTMLRAQIEPLDAAAVVSFFVDGRQVCSVAKAPYDCEWYLGRTIAPHRIRAVAAASGGVADTRAVATFVARGSRVAEPVDVALVEVPPRIPDGRNKYVTGLPQAAFRVFEDG